MPSLPASMWTTFADALFRRVGVPDDEAARVAESLVDANLCGHDSHGLIRVIQYIDAIRDGRTVPGAPFTVVKETAGILVVDGGKGLGQVQAASAAQTFGSASPSVGIGGGHVEALRTHRPPGRICRSGRQREDGVHRHGQQSRLRPRRRSARRQGAAHRHQSSLSGRAPTKGDPVILDIGTSVVAEGKVRVLHNKGQQVPDGWLLDPAGQPTTDPGVLYREPRGSILPLGTPHQAYKGFGIGLLLDMFVGGLSGAPCSTPGHPNLSANAVFFLVLDVAQFAGAEHFVKEVTGLAENVRACPRVEGVAEITLPGDPERKTKAHRLQTGITVDDGTWDQLVTLATKLQVKVPYI